MNKMRRAYVLAFLAAFGIGFALPVGMAASASATTGGVVANYSSGNVWVSAYNPFQNGVKVPPNYDSLHVGVGNVQCFYPTRNVKSQWGGIYYAWEIRCMSNNGITLIFKNA